MSQQFVFRSLVPSHVTETLDKALQAFGTATSIDMGYEMRQTVVRAGIKQLVEAHNDLVHAADIGEQMEVAETFECMNWVELRNLLDGSDDRDLFLRQIAFVRGAVNDPFLNRNEAARAQEDFDIGIDFREHAIMNIRKAQTVIRMVIDRLMTPSRY